MRALKIFERKVLLSILNGRKFSNPTFFIQMASHNLERKKLGFSETISGLWFLENNSENYISDGLKPKRERLIFLCCHGNQIFRGCFALKTSQK